jgi:hypothetical protein
MKIESKGSVTLAELEPDSAFWQAFNLGLRLEVQLLVNSAFRIRAELVGFEKRQYLLLRIAATEPALPKTMLSQQTGLICRFVVEAEQGRVYAFKSEILNVISHPYRLLVIRYPEVAQYLSLRSDKRNPVRIPVKIQLAAGEQIEAELLDLSVKGGLLALSQEAPLIGRGEQLSLLLPDTLPTVAAMVKRSTRPTGTVRLGLEFAQALPLSSFECLMQLSHDK